MTSSRLKNIEVFLRKSVLPQRKYNYDLGDCIRWFVGGSGRSGTTFVATWLAQAGGLYRAPLESKFIAEGGGLRELIDHLTYSWNPTGAAQALRNFDRLMRARLPGFEEGEYDSWGYHHQLSKNLRTSQQIYFGALENFYSAVPMVDFMKQNPPRYPLRSYYTPSDNIVERQIYPAKLPRNEAVSLAAKLVDDLFSYGVRKGRRKGYMEKTPSNIFCADFILEMFPDARFVHCMRDPINVVKSYCNQRWFSNQPEDAVQFLAWAFEQIIEVCERLANEPRFITVRLETLKSECVLSELEAFLGVRQGCLDRKGVRSHAVATDSDTLYQPLRRAREYFGYV